MRDCQFERVFEALTDRSVMGAIRLLGTQRVTFGDSVLSDQPIRPHISPP